MKARQKWDLLVLNSKGFVNFVMSNLTNFEKFYTLKNSHFLYERKILDFPIKLTFFIISTTSHVSKYTFSIQFSTLHLLNIFRNMWGSINTEKKANFMGKSVFSFDIENVSFLMYTISRNFLSSTLQSLQNPYYLVPVNPIFDELSFGIKFIIYSFLE